MEQKQQSKPPGKWRTFFGKLATVGRTAAGAAVQTYTGGLVPASVITGQPGTPPGTPPQAPPPTDRATAAVKAARAEFKQWPPAPDEVNPGEGGGTTPGISRDQLGVLGELWLAVPGHTPMYVDTATAIAVAHIAYRFGWEVEYPRQLDPDQYYVARQWLREWVGKGVEPDWPVAPAPDAVDHNAREREYQRAVADPQAQAQAGAPAPQPQPHPTGQPHPLPTFTPAPEPTPPPARVCPACDSIFTPKIKTPATVICPHCAEWVPADSTPEARRERLGIPAREPRRVQQKAEPLPNPLPPRPSLGFAIPPEQRNQTLTIAYRMCPTCQLVYTIAPGEPEWPTCARCCAVNPKYPGEVVRPNPLRTSPVPTPTTPPTPPRQS